MIITQFDNPITAEEARQISLTNKDDSVDRYRLRSLMEEIRSAASFGYTRYQGFPKNKDLMPSERVCDALRSMGYKVTVKRAYHWDDDKKDWSDRPQLDQFGREQFFIEITWG